MEQVLRLHSEVLLDIIAGRKSYYIFDNHREMARRKMRLFGIKCYLVLLAIIRR